MKGVRSALFVPAGPDAWLRSRYPAAVRHGRKLLVADPAQTPRAAGPGHLAAFMAAECKKSQDESWIRCRSSLVRPFAAPYSNAATGRGPLSIGNPESPRDLLPLGVRSNSSGRGVEQGQRGGGGGGGGGGGTMKDMIKLGDGGESIFPPLDVAGGPVKSLPHLGGAVHGQFSQWKPEYQAENVVPPNISRNMTFSRRGTRVNLAELLEDQYTRRKTKIVATLGPASWDKEMIGRLLDAGMNIVRLNFSHGTHDHHLEVLERLREVCKEKGKWAAVMLDTMGPEVKTAMLRNHRPIFIDFGQEILIETVGREYVHWEGYKDPEETRIGISHETLCSVLEPGDKIQLQDGTVSVEITEIVNPTVLKGRALNGGMLGENKSANFHGKNLNLPILQGKDIYDLQQFAVKHKCDFVAASFVQSRADVQEVRSILDSAGGHFVKIISKVEDAVALQNIDEIIDASDGIMVARGDLGTEIPPERVALAQKMIITKCNIAGKMVITARQMLESMIKYPIPTRAEMTDVANAVFDGTDCVMLSGETAVGRFPDTAVSTMAHVLENAELGLDYYSQFLMIRFWNYHTRTISPLEATLASAAKSVVELAEDNESHGNNDPEDCVLVIVVSSTGRAANIISKYRPQGIILVVTDSEKVARGCNAWYGQEPYLVPSLTHSADGTELLPIHVLLQQSIEYAKDIGLLLPGQRIVFATGATEPSADEHAMVSFSEISPIQTPEQRSRIKAGKLRNRQRPEEEFIKSLITTAIDSDMITDSSERRYGGTKIICRLGPASWSEESIAQLIDGGMNMARFCFDHGSHEEIGDALERFRKVCLLKNCAATSLLDLDGPTVKTAMLKDHKPVLLVEGGDVFIHAVGSQYKSWQGYSDALAGEVHIGISYRKLCQYVGPGDRVLLQDGSIVVEVVDVVSDDLIRGVSLNTCYLWENKSVGIPGVQLDLPSLTRKDIFDLQNFCPGQGFDYVAVPRVQGKKHVEEVRKYLAQSKSGGAPVKVVSKIENEEGLRNIDEIIAASDGIMVARGILGTEISPAKVPMAQKMLITKANIAGKFVITSGQLLESMITSPIPTRAEMTDVANAVFDGTDAVMLSFETAVGKYPIQSLKLLKAMAASAELGINKKEVYDFIRNQTPKPMSRREAVCSSVAQSCLDMQACLIVIFTNDLESAILISKWRPAVPIIVVTTEDSIRRQCCAYKGLIGMKTEDVTSIPDMMPEVVTFARTQKLADLVTGDQDSDQIIVVSGEGMAMQGGNLEFSVIIFGDERSDLIKPTGYQGMDTFTQKSVKVSMNLVCEPTFSVRKTKILGTMGPKCNSEEMMGRLLDEGLNIARFNFSHGTHESHKEVLTRFRKVCARKHSWTAVLLDTKGPEIRTAMLKGHTPILLEKGQEILIEAVGALYDKWEGYKDATETRIGVSYDKLCQSVSVGNRILIADGSICIEILEILDDKVLRGRVLNSKELGERKNCNLPGVQVDIPVLTEKDIDDIENFCVAYDMDFLAASFVQSGNDVDFVRRVLDDAGGFKVKIISKIENEAGLTNIDDIIAKSDGIMVARGDLGMEIPSEKVALAQKMIITKCNVAGKFVITATQMLESMVHCWLPTRAEMTDVANAVFDGTDCVMLSGETANGKYPANAVKTMAAVVQNAEVGVNYSQVGNFIRDFTPTPTGSLEAMMCTVAKNAVDLNAGVVVVFSESGISPLLISKYRPAVPVIVITSKDQVARHCNANFALIPYKVEKAPLGEGNRQRTADAALRWSVEEGHCRPRSIAIMVQGRCDDGIYPYVSTRIVQDHASATTEPPLEIPSSSSSDNSEVVSIRCNAISVDELGRDSHPVRKTKIISTLGPSTSDTYTMSKMLDAGLNIARINLSHQTSDEQLAMLQRFRRVCKEKGKAAAIMVDTRGPEIRTAMLRGHQPIRLEEGQEIFVEAVGNEYEKWEGHKTEEETRIGISHPNLSDCVYAGDKILLGDAVTTIIVTSVLSDTVLLGRVKNSILLKEKMPVWLPATTLDLPVISSRDINDLKNLAVKYEVDYVAASFVQSAADIAHIRRVLDSAGGHNIKIIAKVATKRALKNIDEIIAISDAIFVARGNLGIEIRSEKVALAQKLIITKCNLAGKVVITAHQMLESMVSNPLPTRAEMTDVANAVFDGTDCVVLAAETAVGKFPAEAVSTIAAILENAEAVNNYYAMFSFLRDFTAKPFSEMESIASSASRACIDCNAVLCIVVTKDGENARLVTKYRPNVPVVVVSNSHLVVQHASACFGQYGCHVPSIENIFSSQGPVFVGLDMAKKEGLLPQEGGEVVVVAESSTGMFFLSSFSVGKKSGTEENIMQTRSIVET